MLLSAERVDPAGKAYGLDMTAEMPSVAEEDKRKASFQNVGFLKGEIESIPWETGTGRGWLACDTISSALGGLCESPHQ